jgi:hypothetical protein
MSEKRVGLLIETLPELQALNRDIRQLSALQSVLAEVLPGNLATSARVALVKAGELILFADNGAVAAKVCRDIGVDVAGTVRAQEAHGGIRRPGCEKFEAHAIRTG